MTMIKRSVMVLYSGVLDIYSHQVRIVLAEKGVAVDVIQLDPSNPSQDFLDLNPYNTLPTLVDRDLVLYQATVIMEYLDERFPHPPLLPVYPVSRAKSRLMMYRIERDWYSLLHKINNADPSMSEALKMELQEGLTVLAPVFNDMPYFLSDEFTLVDCYIAPMLWRLPSMGIHLPPEAKSIEEYAERVFSRDSFQASLTEAERELRTADELE